MANKLEVSEEDNYYIATKFLERAAVKYIEIMKDMYWQEVICTSSFLYTPQMLLLNGIGAYTLLPC